MKIFNIFSVLFFLIAGISFSDAQEFLSKGTPAERKEFPGKKISFKEMQKRFDDWSKTTDLSKTKNWKYYKRWESDMEKKTDGKGELADPAIYINEAINIADQKRSSSSAKFLSTTWSPVGPFAVPNNLTGYMENGIGRINCIAFHPTDSSTYYIGVAQGGLWKTTNNGLSWTPLTDNLPITRISDICIDPNNTNTIYISLCDFEYIDVALNVDWRKRNTHYGLGVYKTTDGGTTWAPTGLSFQLTDGDASLIRKIVVNPANSSQLVACGVSGMYSSANGGTTWTKTLDSLFWDLEQDPVNPATLYAASGWLASSNTGSAAIYKSTNFGSTWAMLNTGIPATDSVQRIRIAIAPSDHNYIYAFAVNAFEGSYGIYKSTNAGANWTFINPGLNLLTYDDGSSAGGQGTYDLGFSVNPSDKNTVYVGGINIWASTDGALTFNPATHWTLQYGPTVHADIHFIETQPSTGNIFVCNDGGLYRTSNLLTQTWTSANNGNPWPTTWTNISSGMATTSFYRLSSSRNTTGRLVAGAQDNSTFYYDGAAWSTIFGGDGMDNYLDPQDDNTVMGSSQYGYFSLSHDGGVTSMDPGTNVTSESGEWTTPLIADYTAPGTLYAGFITVVNASNDGGNSWYSLSPLPSNGIHDNEMSALAVSNSNPNVIYAARRIRFEYASPGGVYRTTDGGGTWTDITSNLPDSLYYTSLDISQTDPNTAYVAMAGLVAGQKIYKTTDGGATWQNISFNLPNAPVNCVKTVTGSNGLLVATDFGVFVFDPISGTWINVSSGLPNVIISDIEFNTVLDKIYVCTFGRGIWENTLSTLIGIQDHKANELGIELFPSPNNGTFTIQLLQKDLLNESLLLEIVDITGREVFSQTLKGQSSYKLNTSLNSGMYFARIKNKDLNGVKSFLVR
jgi:photosystem II stability/assembly factor-like uncharacterized protein